MTCLGPVRQGSVGSARDPHIAFRGHAGRKHQFSSNADRSRTQGIVWMGCGEGARGAGRGGDEGNRDATTERRTRTRMLRNSYVGELEEQEEPSGAEDCHLMVRGRLRRRKTRRKSRRWGQAPPSAATKRRASLAKDESRSECRLLGSPLGSQRTVSPSHAPASSHRRPIRSVLAMLRVGSRSERGPDGEVGDSSSRSPDRLSGSFAYHTKSLDCFGDV